MKPSARRKVERTLQTLMGDNCSICGKPFAHNSKTVGGVTAGGVPAMAGECCAAKITDVLLSGIYVTQEYGQLGKGTKETAPPLPPPQLAAAVDNIRAYVDGMDRLGAETARRGGISAGRAMPVTFEETDWKKDDADWFRSHPNRSHRLRALRVGEEATLFGPTKAKPGLPAGHEFEVLVRQVEPGKRLRIPFARNIEMPIPDIEAVIHALFDTFAPGNHRSGVVTKDEIARLAAKYAASEGRDS